MINMFDRSIILVWLFFLIIRKGIKIEISTSNIRNITISMIKLVEKLVFFSDKFSKPHSNGDFLSFFLVLISMRYIKITISLQDSDKQKIIILFINFIIF